MRPASFQDIIRQTVPDSDPNLVASIYQDLVRYYSQSHRFYHTLEHVESCRKELQRFLNCEMEWNLCPNPLEVQICLFYHDIIYDPRTSNNEELSALKAEADLKVLGMDYNRILTIKRLIMATKHIGIPTLLDEMFVRDVDLSIFGSGKKTFDAYEAAIRKEYTFVPESEYRDKRREVLVRFLNMSPLYFTSFYNRLYAEKARNNLRRSVIKFLK